jgi:N-acyl-D-aspartate/D-glutamate deacylase
VTRSQSFVVRGGVVYDGTGAAGRVADVEVRDGIVTAVTPAGDHQDPALDVVDATGLDILPGFIDAHSHDDAALFRPGGLVPKIGQGVTTTVLGNCGLGVAPSHADLEASAAPVLGPFPPGRAWPRFADYLADVASSARAVNTVALVPHTPLRAAVLDFERRAATPAEVSRLAGAVGEALDAGAGGVSLGLMYSPGDSATRPELLALARETAARGKLLVAHIRNEADQLRASIDELADLGRSAGTAIHISHLKVTGPRSRGTMPAIIDHLDALRSEGVDVTADVYPYDAGSTTVVSLFPPWALSQGTAGLVELLRGGESRRDVLASLREPWQGTALENQWAAIGAARILLSGFHAPALAAFEGLSVADIATIIGLEPLEALADLVVATEGQLTVIVFHTDFEGVKTALAWPHTMVGSDGLPRETGSVHPRLYGTFPRALTLGVLSRAEIIKRMTQDPAARFGLRARGAIAPGNAADLQLIDPATYADRAIYSSPRLSPTGLMAVYVNGLSVGKGPAGVFLPVS